MKIVWGVFGLLLAIVGGVWFAQGIGVLPGSFMTGQRVWAVYGAIAIVIGLVLFWRSRRRPKPRP